MVDFLWMLGHARTTFTHASKTISLPLKSGKDNTLSELCTSSIPPCRLNPLLFNGHVQTAWTVLKIKDIPIIYRRKIFQHEDPAYVGEYTVDFVAREGAGIIDNTLPPRTTYFTDEEFAAFQSDDDTPMLVALHGLSGGSHELYLRQALEPLLKNGWEACVINSRGCAKSKITSGVLYNARATWDIRQTVKWLRKTFPNRPLFGIGFSMGANILTNYLGEEGDNCLLKAAVVCSNPWNLEVSSLALQRSYIGLNVYSRVMGKNMKNLFETHVEQIAKNPKVDIEAVRNKVTFLHEFDRELQCPSWGYPTERAYHRDASSSDSVLAVRIPLLAINAEDDPISVNEAIPYEEIKKNPFVVLCTTNWGGHLSWFQLGGGRWFATAVAGFLEKMANDVDLAAIEKVKTASDTNGTKSDAPIYLPMRRKLKILL